MRRHSPGLEDSPAQRAFDERLAQRQTQLPDRAGLWDRALAQGQAAGLALPAFCAAHAVNAVQVPHMRSDEGAVGAAKQIARAVGNDRATWLSPTAAAYLGRLKKRQARRRRSPGS